MSCLVRSSPPFRTTIGLKTLQLKQPSITSSPIAVVFMVNRDALLRRLYQLQRELLRKSRHELGGEWLTEAEIHNKDTRTEDWQARQQTIRQNQVKDFEKINYILQPIRTLDCDGVPSAALTNTDDSSIESDDGIILYAAGSCYEALEGAT